MAIVRRSDFDLAWGPLIDALLQFSLADALDVAIVAIGLYAGISWLRRSQAALVAVGFALIAVLYLGARWLGLELTQWVLEGVFAALGLVLVVLFQDELRQAFEELAAWALGRRNDHRPRLEATDVLVEVLSRFARERVGALVVIPGIQKLDRHLSGGIELRGRLSDALLDSLFDPSSAGHDGAVVVEDREVVRFGVQLPLSRRVNARSGTGTRHSAALGLAERTDALCIVVSEERGVISTAAEGAIESVRDADELATRIRSYCRQRRSLATPAPNWLRVLQQHQGEKVASFALAFALWLFWVAASAEPVLEENSLPPVAAQKR